MSIEVRFVRDAAVPESDDIAAITAVLAATGIAPDDVASIANTPAQSVVFRWRLAGREYGVTDTNLPRRHRIATPGDLDR